jgi:hypothetical protein
MNSETCSYKTDTLVTCFPRKDLEHDSLELMRVADLEDAILDEVVKISHPSDAFSSIIDVGALIVKLAATNLLLSTDNPGLNFLHKYRQTAANMV